MFPKAFWQYLFGQCQKGVSQPANTKPGTRWIPGKVESSELAERFNLRGRGLRWVEANASALERSESRGYTEQSGEERAKALLGWSGDIMPSRRPKFARKTLPIIGRSITLMENATMKNDYYVYVFIDPRNYEAFYYGKGCGGRKDVDRDASGSSEKALARRIREIRKMDEEPIVRVIAKGLTQDQALIVETALIWNHWPHLKNASKGHFSKHFRPENRMHETLPSFDFFNGIFYVNVSEGDWRSWKDCRRFGFLSAGGGRNWSEQLDRLNTGDVVVAYLKKGAEGGGYAGIGVVTHRAVRVRQFRFRGKPIRKSELEKPGLFTSADDRNLANYLVGIKWHKTFARKDAKFQSNAGLFTPQRVVASLANQPKTRKFVEDTFGLSLDSIASGKTLFEEPTAS